MKNIYKKQSQMTKEAMEFLWSELYAENKVMCPSPSSISITAQYKEQNEELYKEDIKIFKALFNAGNENYKTILWNRLMCYYRSKIYIQDFTPEEAAFIKSALKAKHKPIWETNVNPPIKTTRLVLRAFEKSDTKLFVYHYKCAGDFFAYTGYKPTSELIKQFADRCCTSTFFAIEEQNEHRVIGYIGLSIREHSAYGLLEYYIFKEYRNKGYCKEAICALIGKALNDKLYEPIETVRDYVYDKKAIKLNAIRAKISAVNIASLNTVKSCGFIHEATLNKTIFQPDLGWTDEEIYWIAKHDKI